MNNNLYTIKLLDVLLRNDVISYHKDKDEKESLKFDHKKLTHIFLVTD